MTLSTEWNILWIIQTSKSLSKHWRKPAIYKSTFWAQLQIKIESESENDSNFSVSLFQNRIILRIPPFDFKFYSKNLFFLWIKKSR